MDNRYLVVRADTTDDLEVKLNEAYGDGYMIVGPCILNSAGGVGSSTHRFVQIMELRESHKHA